MKLLIITQKIDKNDDVLGFMHGWIAEFAKHCDEVIAVGLFVGAHSLPKNVRVYSLGKEGGVSRTKYLWNFFRIIWNERKNYDAVFVHMNQIYVLLGGLIWKLLGKKVALWYAHGYVPFSLRIAMFFIDSVFTSTKSGFRITSKKVNVIGQGIDMVRFSLVGHDKIADEPFTMIIVGRISPVKDYETLLRAAALVATSGAKIRVVIVGGAGLPEQETYLAGLRELSKKLSLEKIVQFTGAIPNSEIGQLLASSHVFVNTSNTGSFDKAVGEAMASGLPVLTSNEAFREVLGSMASELMFSAGDHEALAKKIQVIILKTNSDRAELGKTLRGIILARHSLETFVGRILSRLV